MDEPINVLGGPLTPCSDKPITGFFRDNMCNTCQEDIGSHTVCIQINREFLEFSKSKGNDLSTPMLQYGFPGLYPGDRWCLCAARWKEAYENNMAPRVYLENTHIKSLEIIPFRTLIKFAADLN